MRGVPIRWVAVSIFVISSALNLLDRQILAALAPTIQAEFHLSAQDYGLIVSAFSLTYALGAPFAGLFIDRVGLNLGASLAVFFWSCAGVATGLMSGLRSLIACRAALGLAEAGGIPAAAKSFAVYLPPRERALGSALSQVGLTIGGVGAPLVATWAAVHYGWRAAFLLTGVLGFLWIPLWLATARRVPRYEEPAPPAPISAAGLARDLRLAGLVAGNMLLMTVYSLWVNWTTIYFVRVFGMSQNDANRQLAWIPSLAASLGGLFGGWLALRWISAGMPLVTARLRVILLASIVLLATAALPWMPDPLSATALICLSYFACVAASVNVYALPLDLFGSDRAAFAVSTLTGAYGLMQVVFSPVTGAIIDRYGFPPVCLLVSVLPLASWIVIRSTVTRRVSW